MGDWIVTGVPGRLPRHGSDVRLEHAVACLRAHASWAGLVLTTEAGE